jgi:hypothetical protein
MFVNVDASLAPVMIFEELRAAINRHAKQAFQNRQVLILGPRKHLRCVPNTCFSQEERNMNDVGKKDGLKLRERSEAELQTLKTRAEYFLTHPEKHRGGLDPETVLRQVTQELFERQSRSTHSVGKNEFKWSRQGNTHTLVHRGTTAAKIRVVANHSSTNRDVYSAELFGVPYPRTLEHIDDAKAEILEKVRQRLAQESGRQPAS